MGWTPKADLRGPTGYLATGAAEDDEAIARFISQDVGPTLTGAAVRAVVEAAGRDADAAYQRGRRLYAKWAGTAAEPLPDTTSTLAVIDSIPGTASLINSATFTANGGIVTTPAAHGLQVGDHIGFDTITGPNLTTRLTGYYVHTVPSSTTFTISLVPGGGRVSISADGSTVGVYRNWPYREWAFLRDAGMVNPVFRFYGAPVVQAGPNSPLRDWVKSDPALPTYAPGSGNSMPVQKQTEFGGTRLDLFIRYNTFAPVRVYVDGRLHRTVTRDDFAAIGFAAGSGGIMRLKLAFTTAKKRLIHLESQGDGISLIGAERPEAFPLMRPTEPLGHRTLLAGDSYFTGVLVGDGAPLDAWLRRLLGWNNIWPVGSSGTGYLKTGGTGNNTPPIVNRVQSDIVRWAPDTVILALGINDYPLPLVDVVAAARTTIDAIRSGLPLADLVVVGPWVPSDTWPTVTTELDGEIEKLCKARGLQFISPIQERWITGTGYVGSPKRDGNADIYISEDRLHPSAAGYQYLGTRLAGHLAVQAG